MSKYLHVTIFTGTAPELPCPYPSSQAVRERSENKRNQLAEKQSSSRNQLETDFSDHPC